MKELEPIVHAKSAQQLFVPIKFCPNFPGKLIHFIFLALDFSNVHGVDC